MVVVAGALVVVVAGALVVVVAGAQHLQRGHAAVLQVPVLRGEQRGQPRLDEVEVNLAEDVRGLGMLQRVAHDGVQPRSCKEKENKFLNTSTGQKYAKAIFYPKIAVLP